MYVCVVPGDLSYLPSTSSLRAIFQFLTEVKESKEEEMSGTKIITSLVCAMGRSLSQWPLPPADYSSLLLPVLDVTESEMMAAGVQVLCGGRGGHVSLLLYLTSPTVFPFLPVSQQVPISFPAREELALSCLKSLVTVSFILQHLSC